MNTGSFISPNSLMIECLILPSSGTTQQNNPFGTQQQLAGRKVVAIETVSAQDVRYSPISTGNPNLPQNIFNNAFLRLYTASLWVPDIDPMTGKPILNTDHTIKMKVARPEGLYYDQIPLPRLRTLNNYDITNTAVTSSSNSIFRMRPTEISWATKSSVVIPNSTAIGQTYSALFIVHYLDEGDQGLNYMQW